MGICDWWGKWRFDRALKRGNEALDRIVGDSVVAESGYKEYQRTSFDDAFKNRERLENEFLDSIFKPVPKPDTVESVLNQFIALGHDKPEVVIKGVINHGGDSWYRATIDGSKVYRRGVCVWLECFDSVEQAEYAVTESLQAMLNKVPVEEIEITY